MERPSVLYFPPMVDFAAKRAIMGILNVTPDSFYDGGRHNNANAACVRAEEMLAEGADSIDIGGESTGPGSEEITQKEELRRVLPVIKTIREKQPHAILSIDTYHADVARSALEAGAQMINDVTAGRGDPGMFALIAEKGCSFIMMRSKDSSARTTAHATKYADVLKTIHAFFEERIEEALTAGVKKEQIILDPGLGHFVSSDPTYSWHVLENLEFLRDFGCPILVSPSRKSFTARTPDEPPSERLERTLEATEIAIEHGATIIRTHDVAETKELLKQVPVSSY